MFSQVPVTNSSSCLIRTGGLPWLLILEPHHSLLVSLTLSPLVNSPPLSNSSPSFFEGTICSQLGPWLVQPHECSSMYKYEGDLTPHFPVTNQQTNSVFWASILCFLASAYLQLALTQNSRDIWSSGVPLNTPASPPLWHPVSVCSLLWFLPLMVWFTLYFQDLWSPKKSAQPGYSPLSWLVRTSCARSQVGHRTL